MRTYIALLVGLLFACSGAEEWEGDELGTAEQAISFPVTGVSPSGFVGGTRTATSRGRCNMTSTGQVCVVPDTKSLTYCIDRGTALPQAFTSTELSRIQAIVNLADSRTGWTFTAADHFNCFGVSTDLIFFIGSVGSSGSGSNDIVNYVTNTWNTVGGALGGRVGLTEGSGVTGNFEKWTEVCRIQVDRTDIYAKGSTSTQDNNLFDHAAGHGLFACLGMGGRTDNNGSSNFTRQAINFNASQTLSPGEGCSLDNFSAASGTVYTHGGASCPNN